MKLKYWMIKVVIMLMLIYAAYDFLWRCNRVSGAIDLFCSLIWMNVYRVRKNTDKLLEEIKNQNNEKGTK
jgi:hypothetical protein